MIISKKNSSFGFKISQTCVRAKLLLLHDWNKMRSDVNTLFNINGCNLKIFETSLEYILLDFAIFCINYMIYFNIMDFLFVCVRF